MVKTKNYLPILGKEDVTTDFYNLLYHTPKRTLSNQGIYRLGTEHSELGVGQQICVCIAKGSNGAGIILRNTSSSNLTPVEITGTESSADRVKSALEKLARSEDSEFVNFKLKELK